MASSLSSVVSNLVRASMGSSVSNTVTDEDLDRHVAELILKEAKQKAERYGKDGIKAYLRSAGISESNAPKANKRFLSSIIRSTDDHNKTILRAQAVAAQEVKREREELERRERRARAEEAAAAERIRRSKRRDEEDTWDGRARREKRRMRSWEMYSGTEGDDCTPERVEKRRRYRSTSRDQERRKGKDNRTKHHNNHEEERPSSHRDRRDNTRSKPPVREVSVGKRENKADELSKGKNPYGKRDSRRSRSSSIALSEEDSFSDYYKQRTRKLDSDSDQNASHLQRPQSRSSMTSRRLYSPSENDACKESRLLLSPIVSDDHLNLEDEDATQRDIVVTSQYHLPMQRDRDREAELRRELRRPKASDHNYTIRKRDGNIPYDRSSSPEGTSSSQRRKLTQEPNLPTPRIASSSPRHSSDAPSRSPPRASSSSQLPSKMDKYFEETYDPRLDVAPLQTPKVPATGLIDSAEFEGWDAMLELIRLRKEDREEKKRMERLGLTKDKMKDKKKSTSVSGLTSDRWTGSVNIMEIEYKKRGSVREWDLGKEGF